MVQFDRARSSPPADIMLTRLFPEQPLLSTGGEPCLRAVVPRGRGTTSGHDHRRRRRCADQGRRWRDQGVPDVRQFVPAGAEPAARTPRLVASGPISSCALTTWPGVSPGPTSSSPPSCGWAPATSARGRRHRQRGRSTRRPASRRPADRRRAQRRGRRPQAPMGRSHSPGLRHGRASRPRGRAGRRHDG